MTESSKIEIVEYTPDPVEKGRRDEAGKIAHDLVMNVKWPWTDRQKRLWYIGVLADTGWLMMDYIEAMTIEQLQDEYKSLYGSR